MNTKKVVPEFEYVFDKTMHVLKVKNVDDNNVLHAQLKWEGKITSELNAEYLEHLKNGVQYWDGKAWRKEVTKVQHSIAVNNIH